MTDGKLKISVIIVNYNTKLLTLKCLESLYKETTNISFETILVDNASTDNSARAVAKEYPQVHLISSKKNIGFAKANNLAAKYANGKYILLLNPDTVIINKAIEKLLTFAQQNEQAGIWGGRTIFPDWSLNSTSCFGEMTLWSLFCRAFGLSCLFRNSNLFNPESFGSWKFDTVRHVGIVTGCFLMIKNELWQQLDGFDTTFFMYGEEVDLCLRAKKRGHQLMFTPTAEIIHHGGASELSEADRMPKVFCAKSTIIRMHWPKKYIKFGLIMLLMWVATRAAISSILGTLAPKKFSSQKQKWAELWRTRKQWQLGFGEKISGCS